MSICSPKWWAVARKVGLSRPASLRPTGLWAPHMSAFALRFQRTCPGSHSYIKVIGFATGIRVGRGWGSESAIYCTWLCETEITIDWVQFNFNAWARRNGLWGTVVAFKLSSQLHHLSLGTTSEPPRKLSTLPANFYPHFRNNIVCPICLLWVVENARILILTRARQRKSKYSRKTRIHRATAMEKRR